LINIQHYNNHWSFAYMSTFLWKKCQYISHICTYSHCESDIGEYWNFEICHFAKLIMVMCAKIDSATLYIRLFSVVRLHWNLIIMPSLQVAYNQVCKIWSCSNVPYELHSTWKKNCGVTESGSQFFLLSFIWFRGCI